MSYLSTGPTRLVPWAAASPAMLFSSSSRYLLLHLIDLTTGSLYFSFLYIILNLPCKFSCLSGQRSQCFHKLLKFTYNHVTIFIWSNVWTYVVNKFLIFDNILITLIQKVSSYKHIKLVPCLLVMWLTCFNFHMHRTDLFLLMNVVYGKIECMNWRWWRQLEGCKSFHISVCHHEMLRQNLTSYYILWKLLKSSVTTNIVVLIRFTNTSFLPNRESTWSVERTTTWSVPGVTLYRARLLCCFWYQLSSVVE